MTQSTQTDGPQFGYSGLTVLLLDEVRKYGRPVKHGCVGRLQYGAHMAIQLQDDDCFAVDTTSPDDQQLVIDRFGRESINAGWVVPLRFWLDCLVDEPALGGYRNVDPTMVIRDGQDITFIHDPFGRDHDDQVLVAVLGERWHYAVLVHNQNELNYLITLYGFSGTGVRFFKISEELLARLTA